MSIFGFTFFIKNYILLKNIVVKGKKVKSSLYYHISFTVFMRRRIFETRQWYTKVNIHRYNNYNIIELYINRLSLTIQIFIAMDYLILTSEKYLYFRKRWRHVPRNFFSPRRGKWIQYPGKYFLSYVYLKDLYKNLLASAIFIKFLFFTKW